MVFFNNTFNTFFGLNLTLVYTFPMCMTWRFHFPLRKYDFNISSLTYSIELGRVPDKSNRVTSTSSRVYNSTSDEYGIVNGLN